MSRTTGEGIVGKALVPLAALALLGALLIGLARPADAATTFEVNSTADTADASTTDGVCDVDAATEGNQCTLRAAIQQANNTANVEGADTISFNIPASDAGRNATTGVFTISPAAPGLPDITEAVTIDGYTQGSATADPADDARPNTQALGNDAVLLVEINGAGAGTAAANGLKITSGGSTIKGLVINRFAGTNDTVGHGIFITGTGATGNKIEGNRLGTNPAGDADLGNNRSGVYTANGATNTTVGGTTPAARNVISGNNSQGVALVGTGNLVQGNYIGTNASGTRPSGAPDLGNSGQGVQFNGASNGTIGGTDEGAGNMISDNGAQGIHISGNGSNGNGNKIEGNRIGTNAAGTATLGNASYGLYITNAPGSIVGGTAAGARNLISGNSHGVVIGSSDGTKVQGNYIGTDKDGVADLGNFWTGLDVNSSSNVLIGGTEEGARNVISGNNWYGVALSGTVSLVQGNYIGTDKDGTRPSGAPDLGNNAAGVLLSSASNSTVGGRTTAARNVISDNGQYGLYLANATGNKIEGNYIGTDKDGSALGNGLSGVLISNSSNNAVGGARAGAPNVIANNGSSTNVANSDGVNVQSGIANRVLFNSIYDNVGLGIDLDPNGVSANDAGDADTGPNNRQNSPVLNSVLRTDTDGSTTISGTLNSVPDELYTIQLFVNPSGTDEGKRFIGQMTDVATDASGGASFSFTAPDLVAGQHVTATATSTPDNDTSEFSNAVAVTELNDPPVNSVPGAQTTGEDTMLVLSAANGNGFSVSDLDGGGNPAKVRLQAQNGKVTLSATGGLTFDPGSNNGTADMTFTGNLTSVNAALDGLRFDPDANYNGSATLTITTDDQGNTGSGGPKTDDDTVAVTVNPVNDAPTISNMTDKTIEKDTNTGLIPFTVGDAETAAGGLAVTGSSSNTTLVPAANVVFGGTGADRTVKVTPAAGKTGTATITVRVSDGTAEATDTFVLTVRDTRAPTVKSVKPLNGATGVAATTNVEAVFSEAMMASTVTKTTFTLVKKGTTTKISATVKYDAVSKKAILNPSVNLSSRTTYVATIKGGATGVKDLAGNPLAANKVWSFTVR